MHGGTHFLEHMMFKGAKKYKAGEFDTIIESNGGSTNAYTTFDNTVYYQSFPVSILDKIIDLEADRMENLLLDEKSFENERNVVIEERKSRYENSPSGKLFLSLTKNMFEGTPYGKSVIGSEEALRTINRIDMKKYFKTFYTPNNATLLIVGDVNTEKTLMWVKDKYGRIPISKRVDIIKKERDKDSLYTHRGRYNREIKINASVPTPKFMLAYKGEAMGTKKGMVQDIISSLIGDGQSSYLTQKYVMSKKPKLQSVYAYNMTLSKSGVFYIGGQLLKTQNLKRFKINILKEMNSICNKAVTERGVQKIKNQYLIYYYGALQTNAGMAKMLGNSESHFGDFNYYKKELDIYNSITIEEVKRECTKLFNTKDYMFLSVWDKHPKASFK